MEPLDLGEVLVMRLIAKYEKDDRVKYISHLDTMRAIQRALRRANIPIAFSKGFNPHPKISFAPALSVGITSQGEYMDIILEQAISTSAFVKKTNDALPKGLSIIQAIEVDKKMPSLNSMINMASYLIKVFVGNIDGEKIINDFLNQEHIYVEKKKKKSSRTIDIRGMIYDIKFISDDETGFVFKSDISTGSQKNLNAELFVRAFLSFMGILNAEFKIHRIDMFIYHNNRYITPMEL